MSRPSSRLSLRQMQVIWAILSHGTMAKAARELNVSQPAISRMVRHAEDRSGLQLFERRGSRLIPTPELRVLGAEFERVFANVDRAQRLTAALSAGWGRPIRISTMSMIAETFLPGGVGRLRREHPGTPIVVRMNNRFGVERDVVQEEADLGLVHGVRDLDTITATPFCEGRVVCLMDAQHPLAGRAEVAPADLAHEDLISMGRRSPLSQKVGAAFEAAGVERRIAIQIADSRLAAQFCAEGLGLAILDPFFIGSLPLDGLVVRPFRPRIATGCYVIHSNRRVLPDRDRDLLHRLQEVGAEWRARFEAAVEG